MVNAQNTNHYKTLGVSRRATHAQIREAFIYLSEISHPDKLSLTVRLDHERHQKFGPHFVDNCHYCQVQRYFQDIGVAYSVLKNLESKREYDAKLKILAKLCGQCGGTGQITKMKSFTRANVTICSGCGGEGVLL